VVSCVICDVLCWLIVIILNSTNRLLLLHEFFVQIAFNSLCYWCFGNSSRHHWAHLCLFCQSLFWWFTTWSIKDRFNSFPFFIQRFLKVQYFRLNPWRIKNSWGVSLNRLKILEVHWGIVSRGKFRVSNGSFFLQLTIAHLFLAGLLLDVYSYFLLSQIACSLVSRLRSMKGRLLRYRTLSHAFASRNNLYVRFYCATYINNYFIFLFFVYFLLLVDILDIDYWVYWWPSCLCIPAVLDSLNGTF